MARFSALARPFLIVLCVAHPASAQDADRIWGTLTTTEGSVFEGFIRWDLNEGSWVDILDGVKDVPEENYRVWLEAYGGEPAVRTIDLMGYRISWDEEDPDFPPTSQSGVRFGHLASLRVIAARRVELRLRSGEVIELQGTSTDIGPAIRGLEIDTPGGRVVELDWGDVERIDFAAVPDGARARSRRLYGTAEDESGHRYTGYVSWDLDEIFEDDILDGEDMDGRDDREIPMGDIESIEPIPGGARVVLTDGTELELTGTNDVDRRNRGVQISDPTLGMVEVEWRQLEALRLHRPTETVGYEAFDGGAPLMGTLITQAGVEYEGPIRWDADEGASWEMLNGRRDRVVFDIELGRVERIERAEPSGARVTLRDGRVLELDDSNDVNWDNRGILIVPQVGIDVLRASDGDWRLIPWEDLREVRFHDPTAAGGRRP